MHMGLLVVSVQNIDYGGGNLILHWCINQRYCEKPYVVRCGSLHCFQGPKSYVTMVPTPRVLSFQGP